MKYDNREDILRLTPHWEGDDDNGRPRVSTVYSSACSTWLLKGPGASLRAWL